MHKLKPKCSVSEEILTTHDKEVLESKFNNSLQAHPYEIFRNNTTAVEVIVKEIKHKGKKKIITKVQRGNSESNTINRLNGDIEKLRSELHQANLNFDEAQRCSQVILCEMKKQLEGSNQRELKTQTKNLALQFENEKLRTLLESKSNLVIKLKKELLALRRMLKVLLKGTRFLVPPSTNVYYLDREYTEFEKDLSNNPHIAVAESSLNKNEAFLKI